MGAEGLEVWDDKLLPEGLSEQNDVALDTPEAQETVSGLRAARGPDCTCSRLKIQN